MEDKQLYVQVAKKNNIFSVDDIRESLPSSCSGEALPALREERELPRW
jgi:hypothetical protein